MQTVPPPSPAPKPAPTAAPAPRGNAGRRFLFVALLLIAAFLAGFVPQWLEVRSLRAELDKTELQLRLADAHRTLGMASHEAQRSNYANAAQAAAKFFDQSATLSRTDAVVNEARTSVALLSYTAQRDEVMALLSAGDPAARERLAGMFLAMEGVLERRE
ncbi:MAG: hypothetical protein ACXW31_17370 [Thermoanaerobaculia bacterium]